MGNCHSVVDCDACFSDQCDIEVSADNDIIGLGVLVSFFVSAILTVIAVTYGYLSDSLPLWYLNEADASVRDGLRGLWPSKLFAPISKRVEEVLRLFSYTSRKRPAIGQNERIEGVCRFVLALSDQQLVTGLAILISAFNNLCTISLYEFRLVIALGWFSSTTHLATLDVLQQYFQRHKVVRNVRIVGMLVNLALLIAGLVMSQDPRLPDGKKIKSLTRNQYGRILVAPLQCARDAGSKFPFMLGVLFFYLFSSYAMRVGRFFVIDAQDKYKTEKRVSCFAYQDLSRMDQKHIENIDQIMQQKGVRKSLRLWKLATRSFYHSFASFFPVGNLSLAYGIAQLATTRARLPDQFSTAATSMSFGQSTALLLLLIPGLTAAEIYFEARASTLKVRHHHDRDDTDQKDPTIFMSTESAYLDRASHGKPDKPTPSQTPAPAFQPQAHGPFYLNTGTGLDWENTINRLCQSSSNASLKHSGLGIDDCSAITTAHTERTLETSNNKSPNAPSSPIHASSAPSWDPQTLALLERSGFYLYLIWSSGAIFTGVIIASTSRWMSFVGGLLLSLAISISAFGLTCDVIDAVSLYVNNKLFSQSNESKQVMDEPRALKCDAECDLQAVIIQRDLAPTNPPMRSPPKPVCNCGPGNLDRGILGTDNDSLRSEVAPDSRTGLALCRTRTT